MADFGREPYAHQGFAAQSVKHMASDDAFSFVLFLDAVEKSDSIVERDEKFFRMSWKRPKWAVVQE